MVEQREWRRQHLAVGLMMALLLCSLCSTLTVLALLLEEKPRDTPEDAVAVFAGDMLLYTVEETPAPQNTPPPDTSLRVEVIRDTPQPTAAAGQRILIYHTHTWEAYTQVEDSPYEETEKWRTKDESHNIVAVGAALANSLRALGYTVVHDTTAFEPPNLEDAYERSLVMLERRAAEGEVYDLYLDVHRDAISSQSTIKRTVNIGGEDVARFMVLVGKGSSSAYAEKPNWEANYEIAQIITASLNVQCDTLARDIKVKTGRFNQHIADRCVLLECGNNENTLEEVLCGVPYLAQAVADALTALQPPQNSNAPG